MTKVLMTGSAGFIGGYLVEQMLDKGWTVVGLDNYSKYGPIKRSYDEHPNYHFTEGDARDAQLVEKLLEGCDHFIAAAAMIGGISYFNKHAYDLMAINEAIMGASCDAAIKVFQAGGTLKKVTYISSSMAYGSTDRWPSVEGDELTIPPPANSYGFQKLAVEYWARAAWQQYRIPFTILRPFNAVGVGEQRAVGDVEEESGNVKLALSHVVPDIIQKLLKGQDPLHILGSGDQVRHYTYGGDLAVGVVTAMEHEDALNEDFNLSTAESTTVRHLAELIWRKVKGESVPLRLIHDDPFQYDVQRRVPDTEKAKKILGFEATTTLDQMLDEVIPWIDAAIKAGTI
jgi:UDP-glucose 4-epimerase